MCLHLLDARDARLAGSDRSRLHPDSAKSAPCPAYRLWKSACGAHLRRRMVRRAVVLLAFVLFSSTSAVRATIYYVRASGDDSRDGLSPAAAFARIRPAARLLRNPGDRLIV